MEIQVSTRFFLTDTPPSDKKCDGCLTPMIYSKYNGKNLGLYKNNGELKTHKKYWCIKCATKPLNNFVISEHAQPFFELVVQ